MSKLREERIGEKNGRILDVYFVVPDQKTSGNDRGVIMIFFLDPFSLFVSYKNWQTRF